MASSGVRKSSEKLPVTMRLAKIERFGDVAVESEHTNLQPDSFVHSGDLLRRIVMARLTCLLRGRALTLMLHLHHGWRRMMICHCDGF